ncbi:hypothetical protein ACP4OV_025320 [Aristida adscensionis]
MSNTRIGPFVASLPTRRQAKITMAGTSVLVALLVVAGLTAPASAATFIVGDEKGWMTGVDYTAWTSGKTFAVGDKLDMVSHRAQLRLRMRRGTPWGNGVVAVFSYVAKEHTVTEVRKKDYYACYGGGELGSDDGGETNVTLTAPGTRYFFCNVTVHCTIGMKLAATVPGAASPPDAAASTATGALVPAMGSAVAVAAAAAVAMVRLALL